MDLQPYLIAVDAGGTKTEAVLFTADGTIVRHLLRAGINPLVSSFDAACSDCLDIMRELCAESPVPVASAYVGMPALQYFRGRIEEWLTAHVSVQHLRAEADGYMLISAMLGHADGAGLVCGTGSGLYVRRGGHQYGVGGWGYIIDGCGSGFVLGRRAVRAAIRQSDGRGPDTLLTDLVNEQIGGDVTQSLPELYTGGRPRFASFARTVFQACARGDAVAQKIFDDCANVLAELVLTGHRRDPINQLVLNGGIFQHFPEYVDALRQRVPKEIHFIRSDVPPLVGAAVEAMCDAGLNCGPTFRTRFIENLEV